MEIYLELSKVEDSNTHPQAQTLLQDRGQVRDATYRLLRLLNHPFGTFELVATRFSSHATTTRDDDLPLRELAFLI